MRHKRIKLSILVLLLALPSIYGQNMYVMGKNGFQTSYILDSIKKLSFSSDNITVHKKTGDSVNYILTNVRYLNFNDLTTTMFHEALSIKKAGTLQVLPNPVIDVLNIQFSSTVKSTGSIEILSFDGKVIYTQVLKNNMANCQINVSSLPKGLYMCRLINDESIQETKFLKR